MYVLLFLSIDFQNVTASWFSFIAIKRQWCRECILKFEGFAKTKDFLLRSDLLPNLECVTVVRVKHTCTSATTCPSGIPIHSFGINPFNAFLLCSRMSIVRGF